MAITLTVTDSQNGGGGVATISGVGAGDSVTLYRASYDGSLTAKTWTSSGSRVGPGTIAVSASIGFYHWMAINEADNSISPLVKKKLSSGQDTFDGIWDAVIERIKSLELDGIADSSILKRWVPKPLSIDPRPAIYVSPIGFEADRQVVLNMQDTGYPIYVVITANAENDMAKDTRKRLGWRRRIRLSLISQPLEGTGVWDAAFIPDAVIDPASFLSESMWASPMGFHFFIRESRGILP